MTVDKRTSIQLLKPIETLVNRQLESSPASTFRLLLEIKALNLRYTITQVSLESLDPTEVSYGLTLNLRYIVQLMCAAAFLCR